MRRDLVLLASTIALAAVLGSPLRATVYNTLLDFDNSDATGCTVGSFQGADFAMATVVDTTVSPPVVTGHFVTQCAAGAFVPYTPVPGCADPFPESSPPWPGGQNSGLDAIETYVALCIGTPGPLLQLGFFSASPNSQGDTLFTTQGTENGDPTLLAVTGNGVQIPTLGQWQMLALAALLALAGLATVRRQRSAARALVVFLLSTSGLGAALASSPHVTDGNLNEWAGHAPIAIDIPNDATVNDDIVRAWATVEHGLLQLRIDVNTASDQPPVANNDIAMVAENSGPTLINVLANDTGPAKLVTAVQNPSAYGGTVLITGGGTGVTYEPAPLYCTSGPYDSFTYTITGGSTATVLVLVVCTGAAPTAVDDSAAK